MSRDLSAVEKKLLYSKVPKALGQGRKSFETKTEANAVLNKAGYKKYFDIDHPIVHTDKKAKHHQNGTGASAGPSAGPSRATVVAKSASKSKKHISVPKVLPLDKVQAGRMLIELDSDLKPDVAKIMEEFIDSNDHLTMEVVEACKLLLSCDDDKKDYVIVMLSSMLKINETEPSIDLMTGKRLFEETKTYQAAVAGADDDDDDDDDD